MDMMAGSPATTPGTEAALPQRSQVAPAPGTALTGHYRLCFGCGADHSSGLHLRVSAGEDLLVHGEFTVSDHHQGAPGLAHGGILSAALDEALGGLNWLLMRPAVTARLEVEFLQPVPVGATVDLRARIIGVEGRKVYSVAQGRIDGTGKPVAVRARGLFVQVDLEHFRRNGRREEVERAAREQSGSPQRPWLEINP